MEFAALLSQVQNFEKNKLKPQKTSDKSTATLGQTKKKKKHAVCLCVCLCVCVCVRERMCQYVNV